MSTAAVPPGGSSHAARSSWPTAVAFLVWSVAIVGAVSQWALQIGAPADGALRAVLDLTDTTGVVVSVALATFGAIVVVRGAGATYGWLMLIVGSMASVVGFAAHYALAGQDAGFPLTGMAVWIQDLWMVVQASVFLLAALFPDGRTASERWRRPVQVVSAAWLGLIGLFVFSEREATNFFLEVGDHLDAVPPNPTGLLPIPEIVFGVAWLVLTLVSAFVGLGSLLTRWRRADLETRLRMKWVLYALGVALGALAIDVARQGLEEAGVLGPDLSLWTTLLGVVSQVGVVVALAFGVLRFRLYDVDLVINRTIVYVVLTSIVVSVYVGVVVGVGAVLPVQESVLALVVTGLVAVAFAPLRTRVQEWVNRLMFGQRDDPYVVLATMGEVLARSGEPQERLQELVTSIAHSLKLPGVAVELEEDGGWTVWASYGDLDASAGDLTEIPMQHRGEIVGRLIVARRSSREPLSQKDLELLADITHQAAALARSVHLTRALQRSRERLVLAQEDERRRIRHDLHDELGPTLASQTLALDAILERIQHDPDAARPLLLALKEQNKQLVADIRRLVYELRPPALDQLGVAAALVVQTSQLQRAGGIRIDVVTRPDPLPELPAAVEVAAYRIAREAIINTVRHADAGKCRAMLEIRGTELVITVDDDGVGMDRSNGVGIGLTSMRERTEELGGLFAIESSQSSGTRIRASLPLVHSRPDERRQSA